MLSKSTTLKNTNTHSNYDYTVKLNSSVLLQLNSGYLNVTFSQFVLREGIRVKRRRISNMQFICNAEKTGAKVLPV